MFVKTHDESHTRLYAIWMNMRLRCSNPKALGYERYGARGIAVCERWMDYAAFRADVGEMPARNWGLVLIEAAKGFQPGNVRWASKGEQLRARRAEKAEAAG